MSTTFFLAPGDARPETAHTAHRALWLTAVAKQCQWLPSDPVHHLALPSPRARRQRASHSLLAHLFFLGPLLRDPPSRGPPQVRPESCRNRVAPPRISPFICALPSDSRLISLSDARLCASLLAASADASGLLGRSSQPCRGAEIRCPGSGELVIWPRPLLRSLHLRPRLASLWFEADQMPSSGGAFDFGCRRRLPNFKAEISQTGP
jgi:hypothetical protein